MGVLARSEMLCVLLVPPTAAHCQQYVHRLVARMPYIHPWGLIVSEAGDYVFSGGYTGIRGAVDLYVNGTNFSMGLLPSTFRGGVAERFTSSGSLVWTGWWLDDGIERAHTFVGSSNYSAARYGPTVFVSRQLSNDRGDIAVRMRVPVANHFDLWGRV